MSSDKEYPLRILQIGMSTNYGGTEAFLMNLYRNIDSSKYQFDFLNVYDEPLACQDEITSLGGNIYNLHLRRREDGLNKYKEGIKKFCKEHHFDVVVQNVQDLINIDMLIYAKKYGIKKRIIYGHNSGFGMKPSKLSLLSHIFNKLRVKKYVTDFVAVSDKASEFLYPKSVQDKVTKKMYIIPNIIDFDEFKYNEEARNRIRKELNIVNRKVYGNICRIDPQKNHTFLLDIFKSILSKEPESILVICGRGPLEEEIKNKAKTLGIDNNVIFLGYVDRVADYYSTFDVFLYPTKFEGFGIVLEEAQANGLPILCSDVVPSNVVVSPLVKLLSLRDNVDKWSEAATSLKLNNNRNDYYKIIEKSFNKEDRIKTIENIYEQ